MFEVHYCLRVKQGAPRSIQGYEKHNNNNNNNIQ